MARNHDVDLASIFLRLLTLVRRKGTRGVDLKMSLHRWDEERIEKCFCG